MTIERILAPNPGMMTGTGTNTYLIGNGEAVAVVDPGPDDARHLAAILRAIGKERRVTAILVTHGHSDHLPAARPLASQVGAPIRGHRALPGVERPLADHETLEAGGYEVEALDTPGHTDDSLSFWEPRVRALFTGDVIAGAGTVIVDDGPGGLGKYMRSLDRLRQLGPSHIYPGHGPEATDGLAKVQEYWDHRMGRERQILAALEAHSRSVDALVSTIYPDVQPGLVPMAARNVRAHLDKLREEGRVQPSAGEWELT